MLLASWNPGRVALFDHHLVLFRGDDDGPFGHVQDLVTGVGMKFVSRSGLEAHQREVIVTVHVLADDGLECDPAAEEYRGIGEVFLG